MFVIDYFHKVKSMTDIMTSIGHPLQEEEIVSYLLSGLGSDYDSLVIAVSTCSELISLNDLYAHLISYNSAFQISSLANNAIRGTNPGGHA